MAGQLLKKVFEEVKRRLQSVQLDKSVQIPYAGGQSKNRNKVYIDSRIPDKITIKGHIYNINKYLSFHELVEKAIEDLLGTTYNEAHHEAEWAETKLIQMDGLDPRPYHEFITKTYLYTLSHFDPKLVPKDLDLRPYIEDKKYKTVKDILQARKSFK